MEKQSTYEQLQQVKQTCSQRTMSVQYWDDSAGSATYQCCRSELLRMLKKIGFDHDEKLYADLPIRSHKAIEILIENLKNNTATNIKKCLEECFYPLQTELQPVNRVFQVKSDSLFFKRCLLTRFQQEVSLMADDAIQTFQHLYFKMTPIKSSRKVEFNYYSYNEIDSFNEIIKKFLKSEINFCCHMLYATCGVSTMLNVPFPVVVPGGRFAEGYYWDTYWVIRGLLCIGEVEVAISLVNNFFYCIDRYGFVPNGFRKYYMDRSQPPFLAESVNQIYEYLKETGNPEQFTFLEQAWPRLLREYFGFWMNPAYGHVVAIDLNTRKQVSMEMKSGGDIITDVVTLKSSNLVYLNRYFSSATTPRLESRTLDEQLLEKKTTDFHQKMRNIRTAAESGWDFSARWARYYVEKHENKNKDIQEPVDYFETIDTTNIIPIDLNALMYHIEVFLQKFAMILVREKKLSEHNIFIELSDIFKKLAERRKYGLTELAYDARNLVWRDFDIVMGTQSNVISAASVVALYVGLSDKKLPVHKSLTQGWGIIPTQFVTSQQWDSPNVWPPIIQIAAEYLIESNEYELVSTGKILVNNFLKNICIARERSIVAGAPCHFFEKYNTFELGKGGYGGEYANQIGFGFTIGVAVEFVARYSHVLEY